jgi:cytochrome c biogenesis protein CcmG/thiol:disulfide interchange protein DsbE
MSLLLVVAGCSSEPQSAADVSKGLVGEQAPPIDAEAIAGTGPTSLEKTRGKVVIIDLWATYCDPCATSFPRYQELLDRHPGKLAVFAIAIDDPASVDRDEIVAVAEQHHIDFPLFWDVEGTTQKAYDPPALPASYIVDRKGIVRHVHGGYQPATVETIEKEVKKLLK